VMPPLRDRKEDIPALAQHFIREFNAKHNCAVEGLRPEVVERLMSYRCPGNLRELRNIIERGVIVAKSRWIELSDLPPYVRNPEPETASIVLPAAATAADSEKELILKTLEQTANNKAEAARRLGVDVKTIRNKLKSYGLGGTASIGE
jgi:two-component system, NtrC family, response regulator HydG